MEQVKNMFYRSALSKNQIYDNNTILPLKYKQCSKAFDADVESPYFTPIPIIKTRSMSPNTTNTNTKTNTNTNKLEKFYSENV